MPTTPTCLVTIPVGGDVREEFVLDTIQSVYHYMGDAAKVLIVDDTQKDAGRFIRPRFPAVDIVSTTRKQGGHAGGLYVSLAAAYRHSLKHHAFDCVLKLDTDALVIAADPHRAAMKRFEVDPQIGLLGAHHFTCTGTYRPFERLAPYVTQQSSLWHALRHHPRRALTRPLFRQSRRTMATVLRNAEAHGYVRGEHVMGGAYFLSRALLERLDQAGLLAHPELIESGLAEDMIYTIMCYAVGMRLADFCLGDGVMGVKHRGLPLSPADLARTGKAVIHSTRYWRSETEADIRRFFAARRQPAAHQADVVHA